MKATQVWLDDIIKNGNCKIHPGSSFQKKTSPPGGKKKKKQKPVDYSVFFKDLENFGIDKPVSEYKFCSFRMWRNDFAWPDHKLALEIEGGAFTKGRHTRGAGFIKDMEKYNQLAMQRFYLIRVTPSEIQNGRAAELINDFFRGK